jgi:hypothetical protein
MRRIKGQSSYLKNQVRGNLAKAVLSMFIFAVALTGLMLWVITMRQWSMFEAAVLVLLLVPIFAFYFYLRKYHLYSGGYRGEKQVAKLLGSTLGDDYSLINSLYLRDGGGDIDHIVLGPNGVFVLETKNWNGTTSCNGNVWQRSGRRNFKGSPSRQVKRNAQRVKRLIDASPTVRALGVWVEGIVVFTNKHANLRINNQTVTVLKLPQLPSHITTHQSPRGYTRQEIDALADVIVSG